MITHLIFADKFINDFIKFVERNFEPSNHKYLVLGKKSSFPLENRENLFYMSMFKSNLKKYFYLLKSLDKSEKIILHGLFDRRVILFLFFHSWLLKKCYWIMWGGDLYEPNRSSSWIEKIYQKIKKNVIKRIGFLVTQVPGDVDLARDKFCAQGKHINSFVYPSNLFTPPSEKSKPNNKNLNILVGNSSTRSNHHEEIFELLKKYKNENIKIYCPLSYGDMNYGSKIEELGKNIFEEKFIAINQFIQPDEYRKFLESIDIGIFNHDRQQGLGNITTLLGYGKTIYLRKGTSHYNMFTDIGIKIYSAEDASLQKIDERDSVDNKKLIENYFSELRLNQQLKMIFEG